MADKKPAMLYTRDALGRETAEPRKPVLSLPHAARTAVPVGADAAGSVAAGRCVFVLAAVKGADRRLHPQKRHRYAGL